MELHDTARLQALIAERESIEHRIQETADELVRQYGAEIKRSIVGGIPVRDFGIAEEHVQLLMTAYGLTSPSALHRKLVVVGLRPREVAESLPVP